MQINPFRPRTPAEQAKAKAAQARDAAIDSADALRERADRLATTLKLAERVEPVRRRSRRGLALAGAGAVAIAVALRLRKRSSSRDRDVPDPDVTPTAPAGPGDPGLNDPALKAKVESELFADADVPKDKVLVGVADGVVTLRGNLDSEEQSVTISVRAEQIEGVRRVENLITAGDERPGEESGSA